MFLNVLFLHHYKLNIVMGIIFYKNFKVITACSNNKNYIIY